MVTMLSKTQYRNFETGEYVGERLRTYAETISLIDAFPWQAQRCHLRVGLTNPSVTISWNNSIFLKIATYYNGKFALYYLNTAGVVYVKSFEQLTETFTHLQQFFDKPELDINGFRKLSSAKQKNYSHFLSQNFEYKVTLERCRTYFYNSVSFLLYVLLSVGVLFTLMKGDWVILLLLMGMCFFMVLPNFILVVNYYHFSKHKILKLSKANNTFFYGEINNPVRYLKEDIAKIVIYKNKSSKALWAEFAIFKIEFKDGAIIKVPTLFADFNLLFNKFSEEHIVAKHRPMPLLKRRS